jgi:hypothetical protein
MPGRSIKPLLPLRILCLGLTLVVATAYCVVAQEPATGTPSAEASAAEPPASGAPATGTPAAGETAAGETVAEETAPELKQRQLGVADRYERLEKILLRMADIVATEDPQRAALLRQAVRQGRDGATLKRLMEAAQSLDEGKYQSAIDSQQSARSNLEAILKLLQSEARSDRNKQAEERLRQLHADLQRQERLERALQARTEGSDQASDLRETQDEIAKRNQQLLDRMREDQAPSDSKPGNEKPGNEKQSQGASPTNPSQSPPGQQQQQPGQQQPPGQQQQPGGSPEDQSPPPPKSPEERALEQVEEAQRAMDQAKESLDQQKRDQALVEEQKAIESLRQATDAIEQALRQLREEEKLRKLARLEARLRSLYEQQASILERSRSLIDKLATEDPRQVDVQSSNLAFAENKVIADLDRALLLLQEAGASVAFPEALQQVRVLMETVAARFAGTQLDEITTGLQEDVLAALEEMINAVEQEQQKTEKQKNQQQQQRRQQGGGGNQEQPLVDAIAELKLIKQLQERIQRSTQRYQKQLPLPNDANGDVADPTLRKLVQELSKQQDRLYRVTRELLSGQGEQ